MTTVVDILPDVATKVKELHDAVLPVIIFHCGQISKSLLANACKLNQQQPRKPFFMVRYQTDKDFIGREEIMEEFGRRFERGNRVAIAGIGGVGYAFQVARFDF